MGLYFTLVVRPIDMSQQFLNVVLRLLVFAAIFLADTGDSTFNITRYTTGDVFQNINSSKSCNESGALCVFDGESSPFCGENCCNCFCPNKKPTYLLRNGNCTSEDHLMSILQAQSSIQGCEHRMVVAESHIQCQNEVLPTLNTLNPGNKTMYLCPWNKKPRLLHYQFVKNLHTCAIVPEKSLYLLNGSWKRRPRHDPALSKLVVEIGPDPGFLNDRLFLKWVADIGKQYDGLIFSLKLDCRGRQGNTLTSCLQFKKGGSFTDIKPTLKPALLKSTLAQSRSTFVQGTTTETVTTTTLIPTEKQTPSTAHVSTSSLVVDDEGVKSVTSQPEINIVVIILAALAGGLFVLLAMSAVFFLLWRRRRQFHVRKEGKDATNPVYARGTSDTLKMAKISNGNAQAEEELPDYQPLVENTKSRERIDSLPGYRTLSTGQRPPNKQATSDRGVRSSNYLSLIKDDPEEGREYQTLMKDGNPQNFEIVNEEKIPDYAELEERSDSEDSFDSSDSQDYEELPDLEPKSRTSHCVPAEQNLNDLSSDFHDYDEPEGVIVISDNEECQHKRAIKDSNDFHDYADPDDTDEDNVGCHVTRREDLTCYHDYDDPAE